MRPLRAFARQQRGLILAEMMAALLVIGLLDFVTGYDVSFTLFYGVPIFVVAWFCNKPLAILAALIASIAWCLADQLGGHPYTHNWIRVWETSVHVGSFLLIALAGSGLRMRSDIAATRIFLLERSQRLEREIVSISDGEQRRIGQDLHDGLCQSIAALACSAASLCDDLRKLNLKPEATAAGNLAKLLQNTVIQARDLAHELVPAHVAQVGLVLALESLADSISRLQNIHCTFESLGPKRKYADDEATHLYRIAQEAVNNATRHGQAHNVLVSLQAGEDETTLQILDDGIGFPQNRKNGSGMGLNIMRYRARQVGGELDIAHPPSGGTLVSCRTRTNHSERNEVANC